MSKTTNIYSETKFYKEIKRVGDKVQLQDQNGENVIFFTKDLHILNNADNFSKTIKLSRTELINKFLEHSKMVCTVEFKKTNKPKSKKAFKIEIELWKEDVKNAFLNKGLSGLDSFATSPVLDYIEGEMRIMRGWHNSIQDEFGRIQFNDMEDPGGYMKVVDVRTMTYFIAANVKYIVK